MHQQLRAFPVSGLPASPFTQAGSDNGNSQDVPGGRFILERPNRENSLGEWDNMGLVLYIYIFFNMGYVYTYVSQMLHVWNIT